MTDYTPTTEEVRSGFARDGGVRPVTSWRLREKFDRWLTAHDAQVKSEALRDAADVFGHMWQSDQVPSGVVCRALRDRADEIVRDGSGEG